MAFNTQVVSGTNTSDFSISCDRKFDRRSLKKWRVCLGSRSAKVLFVNSGEHTAKLKVARVCGQDSSVSAE